MSVIAVGAFFDDAIGAAVSVDAATVVEVGGSVTGGAVVETSTEPSRSGTSVCVGPDAGGGTGAVLLGVEVVVDERVVVVFAVVVVVEEAVVGVVGVVVVGGAVVVLPSIGGGST